MTKFRVDLVFDCREAESLAMFWTQALHYRRHMSWEGGIALVPEKGEGPPLVLQQVPAAVRRMPWNLKLSRS